MIRLLAGDCRDVLATLPAESAQCVVTSPPYYGLRDYGTALWDGGNAACDHISGKARQDNGQRTWDGGAVQSGPLFYRDTCGKCGAVRVDRQIGLERSPDEYLATMVAVFREVRRVLRRDGTCFINIGDSYVSNGRYESDRSTYVGDLSKYAPNDPRPAARAMGLKPKDLLLMPARLALALQADGWWVRSDIIWHKTNPMPESCTDRPTSSHEHVFLLTKSGTPTGWTHRDGLAGMTTQPPPDYRWIDADDTETDQEPQGWKLQKLPSGKPRWRRINLWRGHDYYYDADAVREGITESTAARYEYPQRRELQNGYGKTNRWGGDNRTGDMLPADATTRNLRNVWTIATQAYSESHFATFPSALAERCIKAGTSERGCCAACGKPWQRITDTNYQKLTGSSGRNDSTGSNNWDGGGYPRMDKHITTTGWAPACQCDAATVPCVVLDPFAGAGTTLLVADRLQRDAIGIELNTAYTEMAMERCRADAPLFTSFPPAEPPEDERMADLFTDMAAD